MGYMVVKQHKRCFELLLKSEWTRVCVDVGLGAEEGDFERVWMCEPMHVSCLACLCSVVRAKAFGCLSIIFVGCLPFSFCQIRKRNSSS